MDAITFKPEGALSFGTIAVLQDEINHILKSLDNKPLIFDLSAIVKCDSAGLALLIDSISQLKKRELNYQFKGVSKEIRSLAKFYEIDNLLTDAD
ncbi:lipid asymmetry maintenance protein MlaB [Legionella sp. W05-934-2]|jgi:ABC-type transporter Mla MlaB component|uniref:STAS domain-containing protein n=1 Tax=Legionella sp. W05-934-2 TaxID=1198649 RepID=UPI0034634229